MEGDEVHGHRAVSRRDSPEALPLLGAGARLDENRQIHVPNLFGPPGHRR